MAEVTLLSDHHRVCGYAHTRMIAFPMEGENRGQIPLWQLKPEERAFLRNGGFALGANGLGRARR
jgi:hypothetical protein